MIFIYIEEGAQFKITHQTSLTSRLKI